MWKQMLPGLRMTLLMTALTGLIYPGVVTGLCQVLFRSQANGSLISRNGQVVGSALIGQNFTRPEYFQPRPSAAGADGYDASASSGSNLGPTSQKLQDRVKGSVAELRTENPGMRNPVPADLATASGSGLDPHLSPASAVVQIERVAKARGISVDQLKPVVDQFIEGRDLGFLGEPRVNVLALNLALDEKFPVR
ncbi:MAG TPA: potassium-transporting ATPase subunit KdpC [Bryobacteraceae bacterium]|nr:potassium-transporting ATPase subunit KdpC [Bryobacteraceae bacterium]HPT26080.1 potassium-transporting ATPase subunit KdpC [Bryobacteraceae bacterium]